MKRQWSGTETTEFHSMAKKPKRKEERLSDTRNRFDQRRHRFKNRGYFEGDNQCLGAEVDFREDGKNNNTKVYILACQGPDNREAG